MYTDTDRSGIGQYQPITPANWYKLDPLIFIPAPSSSQKPTTQQTDTGENTTRLAEVTTFGSMNHYRNKRHTKAPVSQQLAPSVRFEFKIHPARPDMFQDSSDDRVNPNLKSSHICPMSPLQSSRVN